MSKHEHRLFLRDPKKGVEIKDSEPKETEAPKEKFTETPKEAEAPNPIYDEIMNGVAKIDKKLDRLFVKVTVLDEKTADQAKIIDDNSSRISDLERRVEALETKPSRKKKAEPAPKPEEPPKVLVVEEPIPKPEEPPKVLVVEEPIPKSVEPPKPVVAEEHAPKSEASVGKAYMCFNLLGYPTSKPYSSVFMAEQALQPGEEVKIVYVHLVDGKPGRLLTRAEIDELLT